MSVSLADGDFSGRSDATVVFSGGLVGTSWTGNIAAAVVAHPFTTGNACALGAQVDEKPGGKISQDFTVSSDGNYTVHFSLQGWGKLSGVPACVAVGVGGTDGKVVRTTRSSTGTAAATCTVALGALVHTATYTLTISNETGHSDPLRPTAALVSAVTIS